MLLRCFVHSVIHFLWWKFYFFLKANVVKIFTACTLCNTFLWKDCSFFVVKVLLYIESPCCKDFYSLYTQSVRANLGSLAQIIWMHILIMISSLLRNSLRIDQKPTTYAGCPSNCVQIASLSDISQHLCQHLASWSSAEFFGNQPESINLYIVHQHQHPRQNTWCDFSGS